MSGGTQVLWLEPCARIGALFSSVASALLLGLATFAHGATVAVPGDQPTIAAGINAASDGDVVLVAPGTYVENFILSKSVTLASHFLTTDDPNFIDQTIIDGSFLSYAIRVMPTAGPRPAIVGLTVRNAGDGIRGDGPFDFLDNRVTNTVDGIDYEDGSGGLIRHSIFDNNSDDGIDLDFAVDVVIENSEIRDNGNDGIEIRLHPHAGPTLQIIIRDNVISGNNNDGIQLIEYTPDSPREFRIERNLIVNNGQAGIGMMCCELTGENYQGASLLERVYVLKNTFSGNDHGMTGGDNAIVLNNIFTLTTNIALKRVDGGSIAAYNLFYLNGTDTSESIVDLPTTLFIDPLLDASFVPAPGSPAVDAGTAHYEWNSEVVLDLAPSDYLGPAPDMGESEQAGASPVPTLGGVALLLLALLLIAVGLLRSANRRAFAR